MPFAIGGNQLDTGYEVSNSLRFNSGDSPELTKTFGSAGGDTWSYSCWLKRGDISQQGHGLLLDPNTNAGLYFLSTGALVINDDGSSTHTSTELLRDPNAWYHILFTGNGTTNKVYVNNSQLTFSGGTPNIGNINNNIAHSISKSPAGVGYMDGYLSEIHFVDGTEKAPTDFAEFNDNAVWIPKQYTGSYGTNGFFLEFKQTGTSANSSGIGADTSGNDNHFTPTNLAAIDVTTDTPQNNFSTLESLQQRATYGMPTLSDGNLKFGGSGHSSSWGYRASNIEVSSGKWYCEIKCSGNSHANIGIFNTGYYEESHFLVQNPQNQTGFYGLVHDGATVTQKRINGSLSSASITQFNDGDIVGVYLNVDDKELQFYVNGGIQTDFGTVDISAGTRDGYRFVAITSNGSGTEFEFNFGNPTFSISSGNSDANGYGNFEYAPPSGYYSLCTKNLAEYG